MDEIDRSGLDRADESGHLAWCDGQLDAYLARPGREPARLLSNVTLHQRSSGDELRLGDRTRGAGLRGDVDIHPLAVAEISGEVVPDDRHGDQAQVGLAPLVRDRRARQQLVCAYGAQQYAAGRRCTGGVDVRIPGPVDPYVAAHQVVGQQRGPCGEIAANSPHRVRVVSLSDDFGS
jgi:hypothetical protein